MSKAAELQSESIEEHEIRVFISHKSEDKLLAFEVQKALEEDCDRIKCYVSGGDYSKNYRKKIREELRNSHLLLLLFTSPNRVWDWPLFEAGLFIPLYENVTGGSIVYLYGTDSPPEPLKDLHGVKVTVPIVEDFLKKLYLKSSIVSVKHKICPRLTGDEITQKAEAICRAFDDASTKSSYPTYRLLLERPDESPPLKKDIDEPRSGIPDFFVVNVSGTTDGTLSIFNLQLENHTWGKLKSVIKDETKWINELDEAYLQALEGHVAEPTNFTLRNIRTSRIFRVMITKVERSKSRVDSISLVFIQQNVPGHIGGQIFNLLRFGTRFRYEVLEPFMQELKDLRSSEYKSELLKKTMGAMEVIEKEAEVFDLLNPTTLLSSFPERHQKDLMSNIHTQWLEQRNILVNSIEQDQHNDAIEALNKIGELHFRFMELASSRYRDRIKQSSINHGVPLIESEQVISNHKEHEVGQEEAVPDSPVATAIDGQVVNKKYTGGKYIKIVVVIAILIVAAIFWPEIEAFFLRSFP